jgi:tyrosine-protein phosphatase SIW14
MTPDQWATPIQADGLTNAWKVTPNLYRGAEPADATGYASLAGLNVATVVCLEEYTTDEPDMVETADMAYVAIPMEPWTIADEKVVAFLQLAAGAIAPVFVHCVYGADRTGAMIAAFRIVVQGWDKNDALAEFAAPQFGSHWPWRCQIESYLRSIDVQDLKAKAGIP